MSSLSDIGSLQGLLQGLITITVGALIGINTFSLNIRAGQNVSINGDSNTVSIIRNNFHWHDSKYQLSFGFRMAWALLVLLCVLFPSMTNVLLIENFWLTLPLTILSLLGITVSPNKGVASIFFITALLISWFIIANYGLMRDFVGTYYIDADTIRDTISHHLSLKEFFNGGTHLVNVVIIVLVILAISFLLLIQMKNAFSFLSYQGEFDNALAVSVKNTGMSVLMILLASGVLAALFNPSLLWPNINSADIYYAYWLIRLVLYHILPVEALSP